MPRFTLLACQTSISKFCLPDGDPMLILIGRKGLHFRPQVSVAAQCYPIQSRSSWLQDIRRRFPLVFAPGLGRCRNYMVCHLPFTHLIPLKQQGRPPTSGPAEETKVLAEILKLVELGAVREVQHEPYVITAFGVPKKMAPHG